MYSSELINTQAETDCPNCRSNNMFLGPEGRMWRCYDCGYRITVEDFENSILWFCDNCEAFLNAQEGFTDRAKTWKCKMCGFNNDVSEDNVY